MTSPSLLLPIDVLTPQSPGWWIQRLAQKMQRRRIRLELLDAYFRGDPPLPEGAQNSRDAYAAFQRKARSNFAELVVDATRERMAIAGFRTGASGDDDGDELAQQMWLANGLEVTSVDVHENMLSKGDGYAIVGGVDEQLGYPVVTSEDPLQIITVSDPMVPQRIIAALKLFHDDVMDMDYAYLYQPGRVYVASRPRRSYGGAFTFNASAWSWDDSKGGPEGKPIPGGVIPVVRFRNKRGLGEYETHVDLLDRINHMILQRMTIATLQAFRQRAVKGLPDVYPDGPLVGQKIDYTGLFNADPGALWQLPATAEMWESGQVDLTPILSSVKDDIQHLAAVTRTPMHYFSPDAANGSAEGASTMREGQVFKAIDRQTRAGMGWRQVMSLMFHFAGDKERADLKTLQVMWYPAERYSLAERASAAAQVVNIVPQRGIWQDILQVDPTTAARYDTWRADDMILNPRVASAEITAEHGGDIPVLDDGTGVKPPPIPLAKPVPTAPANA